MNGSYDLAIIGGGAAGLEAASFAIRLGAHAAFVEKERIGGDCTWTGCVPSKTLLKAARVAHQMRHAGHYGLTPVEPVINFKSVMSHVRSVIAEIYQYETPEALRDQGIDVFLGEPRFLDAHTLSIGETRVTAQNFLICTGAHPFVPPIPGLDSVDYLTYQTLWDMETLPRHLVVIGAGPIGCEISQAFRRLGSNVTLLEASNRLLPHDDIDAAQVLAEVFSDEGIEILFGINIERVWQDKDNIHLAAGNNEITGDALLVAVGRRPNVNGLDLQKAGIDYDERGIRTDGHLRTRQSHIYAAGDCLGGYQFTHYAGWQGVMAVRNALLPGTAKGVIKNVPWTTFTDPEVAQAGLTEAEARLKLGNEVRSHTLPMNRVDRAQNDGETAGFLKLVYRKSGRLLGVTIVAAQAGEMINEWAIALTNHSKVDKLANTIHVYPTYSIASMQAASDIRLERLMDGLSGRFIRRFARVTRKTRPSI